MPTLLTRCRAAWRAFRAGGPVADRTASPAPVPDADLPRYPPFLQGLPVASTAQILATQSELIAGLQDALAMTDGDYQTLVLPLIARYGAFAHLLPASETHHHRGAGGLFRHGLEVAVHCARASRGRLFALDRLPQERRQLEPRWQLAAAVVGLLHDVGKPVADLVVLDRAGTSRWQPIDETISDWARRAGIDRYFLRWNGQRLHQGHEVFTTSVFPQLLTRELRRWLMDPDPLVWYSLGSVLAGRDDQARLADLMREGDRLSVAQDLRENRLDPEALSLGVPLERYLIDTMRTLLRDGTWAVNRPGARVWVFPSGLHLVWPESAQDVVHRLAEARVPGIPRDPDTLADLLLERQLAIPCPLAAGEPPARYWRLAPAILAREQPLWLGFLRLAEPALLFSGVVPAATGLVEAATAVEAARSTPVALTTAEASPPDPPQAANPSAPDATEAWRTCLLQPPASRAPVPDGPPRRSAAADHALALEQRLLARDPTLGPIQVHANALSVALHGPVLEEARAAGIAEATLIRALCRRPRCRVEQGRLILGL